MKSTSWIPTIDSEPSDEPYSVQSVKRLFEEILMRGIRDAIGIASTPQNMLREARAWLHSDCREAFSFMWLMDELGIREPLVNRLRTLIPRDSERLSARAYNGFVTKLSVDPKVPNFLHMPIAARKEAQLAYRLKFLGRKQI